MGVAKTLWDLLDYRRVSENIVDTHDPGTGDHFAGPRPLRWRVGVSAALVLGAGILVIVVGSEFFRSLPSAPEPLPMPTVPAEPSATTPELKVLVHVVGAVEEPQRILLAREDFGSLDVVKVSHHGSRDQFEGLYQEIDATVGLIGVGEDNTYGHPTRRALDILASAGTMALRSDERGIITVSPGMNDQLAIWSQR